MKAIFVALVALAAVPTFARDLVVESCRGIDFNSPEVEVLIDDSGKLTLAVDGLTFPILKDVVTIKGAFYQAQNAMLKIDTTKTLTAYQTGAWDSLPRYRGALEQVSNGRVTRAPLYCLARFE